MHIFWNKTLFSLNCPNFVLCACPKPQIAILAPKGKGSLVFVLQTMFWTVCNRSQWVNTMIILIQTHPQGWIHKMMSFQVSTNKLRLGCCFKLTLVVDSFIPSDSRWTSVNRGQNISFSQLFSQELAAVV